MAGGHHPDIAGLFGACADDPAPFRRSRTVGAHFGLRPRQYSSGEVNITGQINKMGDGGMRRQLYVAANTMITRDGYVASHRAARELKADGSLPVGMKLRSSKYLNNLIEQDHWSVKQRIAVMIGSKSITNAAITITGSELMHRIRKRHFAPACLEVQGQAMPTI
jgi:hypothetical protein